MPGLFKLPSPPLTPKCTKDKTGTDMRQLIDIKQSFKSASKLTLTPNAVLDIKACTILQIISNVLELMENQLSVNLTFRV